MTADHAPPGVLAAYTGLGPTRHLHQPWSRDEAEYAAAHAALDVALATLADHAGARG